LEVNPEIVNVTYLAPPKAYRKIENGKWKTEITNRYKLPSRFALYVGDVNYNKNIPTLVEACKIAKIPLVMAGKQTKEIEKLDLNHPELRHLRNIDWSGVIRLGFVPDSDLVAIYNLASVYVQPSLYEGFGIPALEAVACGTPLAASKTQALVEILGDDLKYVDPNNAKAIAGAILSPNRDVRLPRVYSWEKTAMETLALYEKICR
jgi:glycosyltransferase involved in cell wall biosynthesis